MHAASVAQDGEEDEEEEEEEEEAGMSQCALLYAKPSGDSFL